MTKITDEMVAEACRVLSKDANARQTLVEMWAGKRRSVFASAVTRLADKVGGTASTQESTWDAQIYLVGNKRLEISLRPMKDTFEMLDVAFLIQTATHPYNHHGRDLPGKFVVHKRFSEELGDAFPSDELVSQLFLMKEFAA